MNQRRNKKNVRSVKVRVLKSPTVEHIEKTLPVYGRVTIGKVSANIPYVDKMREIVSSETSNSPIVMKNKPSRATKILSNLLKSTGIEPLAEIGDVITGKY